MVLYLFRIISSRGFYCLFPVFLRRGSIPPGFYIRFKRRCTPQQGGVQTLLVNNFYHNPKLGFKPSTELLGRIQGGQKTFGNSFILDKILLFPWFFGLTPLSITRVRVIWGCPVKSSVGQFLGVGARVPRGYPPIQVLGCR